MLAKILPDSLRLQCMRQLQSEQQDVLTEIFEPDVNLVIWQRQLDTQIQRYAAELSQFSALQLVATPEELQSLLPQRLPQGLVRMSLSLT